MTLEIFMFGIKGYRAREAAAKLRNNRQLVSEEVRAARYAVLPDKVAQPEAEVEVPVTDETTNSTPPAQTEPEKVEATETETEKVEGDTGADTDAPKADGKVKSKAKPKSAIAK